MKQQKTKVRKIVQKASPAQEDKTAKVMREFKEGKLKTPDGKVVTDKDQAIAIALNEAGITQKDLTRAELQNKLKVAKSKIDIMIMKELAKDESITDQIVEFITLHPQPDGQLIQMFATKLNITRNDIDDKLWQIVGQFLAGGLSKGKKNQVDANELKKGIADEMGEHGFNIKIAEKVARDHLSKWPTYYTQIEKAGL